MKLDGFQICILVAVAALIALFVWVDHVYGEQAKLYVKACTAVHGTVVWNGKYWECLK